MHYIKTNILLLTLTVLFLSACAEEYDDKVFWVNLYSMHTLEDKNNGGKYVDSNSILRVGQYNNIERIFQKYKGPIKGSIVSVWRVTRLPNGKADYNGICGKEPKTPKNYQDESYDRDYEQYWVIEGNRRACAKKLRTQDELDKVNQYFYSRSKPTHEVSYPPRTLNHSHWEATVYNGRVGDLSPEALTKEQKNNLDKQRSHKCYKWGNSSRGNTCYDLEGSDSSSYYTIREHLSRKKSTKKGVVSSGWEGLSDIRISPPQTWVEIKGITINKAQYDYLYEVCKKGQAYCHLNNYKGKLTKEEQEYVKSVTWSEDKEN
jgi:hypothetical protein